MELRAYALVIWRRWWVVLGVFGLATLVGLIGFALVPPASTYQATLRVIAYPPPEPRTGSYYMYDGYYSVLAAEYLNDDMIELIRTGEFLRLAQERARERVGFAPVGSLDGKKAHRLVTITASSSSADGALALAQATGDILVGETQAELVSRLAPSGATVSLVDPAAISGTSSRRALTDLALRAIVGLIAGVALAFLLDYLDDRIRSTSEAEELLGVPVLGAIPRRPGGRRPTRSPSQQSGEPARATIGQ